MIITPWKHVYYALRNKSYWSVNIEKCVKMLISHSWLTMKYLGAGVRTERLLLIILNTHGKMI